MKLTTLILTSIIALGYAAPSLENEDIVPQRPLSYENQQESSHNTNADDESIIKGSSNETISELSLPALFWSQTPRVFDNQDHFQIVDMKSVFKRLRHSCKSLVSITETVVQEGDAQLNVLNKQREGSLFVFMLPRLITSEVFLRLARQQQPSSDQPSLEPLKEVIGSMPSWEFYPVVTPSISFWDDDEWAKLLEALGVSQQTLLGGGTVDTDASEVTHSDILIYSELAHKEILSAWASSLGASFSFVDVNGLSTGDKPFDATNVLRDHEKTAIFLIDLLGLARDRGLIDSDFGTLIRDFFASSIQEPLDRKFVSLLISPRASVLPSSFFAVFSNGEKLTYQEATALETTPVVANPEGTGVANVEMVVDVAKSSSTTTKSSEVEENPSLLERIEKDLRRIGLIDVNGGQLDKDGIFRAEERIVKQDILEAGDSGGIEAAPQIQGGGDAANVESPKIEGGDGKVDAPKIEEGNLDVEALKSEGGDANVDAPKIGEGNLDVEAPKAEGGDGKVNAPEIEEGNADGEVLKPEGGDRKVEAPKIEEGNLEVEALNAEGGDGKVDAPEIEEGNADGEVLKAEGGDGKVEAPKIEEGNLEVEALKAEGGDGKVESPKIEEGNVDVEAPRLEEGGGNAEALRVEKEDSNVEAPGVAEVDDRVNIALKPEGGDGNVARSNGGEEDGSPEVAKVYELEGNVGDGKVDSKGSLEEAAAVPSRDDFRRRHLRRLQESTTPSSKDLIYVKPSQFAMMAFLTAAAIFLLIAVVCLMNIDTPPLYRDKVLQVNKEY